MMKMKIKTLTIACLSLLAICLYGAPASAWFHAGGGSWSATGFRGGTASGGDGSWSATGFRGGTASGGDGSWSATGFRGGTASGGDGSWQASSPYGTAVYGGYDRYYGGTYATYHPPTVVNSYYGAGCYNCGGWAAAGAALGLAAGAAGANTATADAYAAGVAAGSAYTIGAIYPTLPSGCAYSPVGNASYYLCSGTWFSPAYGANGVYYRVVPAP
jgi:hypothetical protein